MHPDQIVGPQQRPSAAANWRLTRDSPRNPRLEIDQAEAEMQQRPQRAVGKIDVE